MLIEFPRTRHALHRRAPDVEAALSEGRAACAKSHPGGTCFAESRPYTERFKEKCMIRPRLAAVCFLTLGLLAANGQAPAGSKSVLLEAVEAAGDATTLNNWRSIYGSVSKTQATSRELGITVRNMSALPGEFDIEWYFVAKPAAGTRRFLYDKGEKHVSLKPSAFEKFAVESRELTNHRYNSAFSGYSYKSGDKSDGWILRARVGEEIVRVKASNPQLEQLVGNKEEFKKFVEAMRKP
jgi:hypothetical protein